MPFSMQHAASSMHMTICPHPATLTYRSRALPQSCTTTIIAVLHPLAPSATPGLQSLQDEIEDMGISKSHLNRAKTALRKRKEIDFVQRSKQFSWFAGALCLPACLLSSCLRAAPPPCQPAAVPACLPLAARPPSFLPFSCLLPACLPARQPGHLPACLRALLQVPASLLSYFLSSCMCLLAVPGSHIAHGLPFTFDLPCSGLPGAAGAQAAPARALG